MHIRRLTTVASPEYDDACRSLTASFGGDHISEAINGGNKALEAARLRASITTTILDLECYVASSEEGGPIEGVMLVKPPGVSHGQATPNAKGAHTEAVEQLLAAAENGDELRDAGKKLFGIFGDIEERAFGPRRVTDMYYISHLGVEDSARGKGMGSGLVRHIVEKAHKQGVPVALLTMTEKNVAIYSHLGFTAVPEAYMEVDLRGVPTRWWVMKTAPPVPATGSEVLN